YAWILFALTLPMLVLQTVDSELARVVGRRTAVDSLFLYGESDWHFAGIARQFAPLVVAGVAVAMLWGLAVLRTRRWILDTELRTAASDRSLLRAAAWCGAFLLLSAAALTIAIRGGVTNVRPLSIVHTHPEPQLGNLALNTPF